MTPSDIVVATQLTAGLVRVMIDGQPWWVRPDVAVKLQSSSS